MWVEALLRLLPATLKLEARGRLLQTHSSFLNMAGAFFSRVAGLFLGPQVVGKKGSALEGPCACGLFVSCQAILFFCDKAKLSLESIVFGGLGTGEASVALSPLFEVAG